jgi:hypothetical protein
MMAREYGVKPWEMNECPAIEFYRWRAIRTARAAADASRAELAMLQSEVRGFE